MRLGSHQPGTPAHSHSWLTHRCSRKRSEVKSRYSETLCPVMSVRMSPVTTLIWGGCPPTLLGQEKPVPCAEQVQRTGSRTRCGRDGADVQGSAGTMQHSEMGRSWPRPQQPSMRQYLVQ